jgi:hypothetical protein
MGEAVVVTTLVRPTRLIVLAATASIFPETFRSGTWRHATHSEAYPSGAQSMESIHQDRLKWKQSGQIRPTLLRRLKN